MKSVRRVVVHDKYPLLEAAILKRPLNCAVIAAAFGSVVVQVMALQEVMAGHGNNVTPFDHASFAVVALLWLCLGVLVFLQRRANYAGQFFLLFATAGSTFLALGEGLSALSAVNAVIYSAGILLFPALLFHFVRAFNEERIIRPREFLLYIPSLLLIAPMAHDFVYGQRSILWRIGVISVAVYLVAAIAQAVYDLFHTRTPPSAAQTRALLFGLVAGTIPGILMFVAPLALGRGSVFSLTWQPYLVLFFLTAMSYAVLLFEFNEADLILRRGVVYGGLTFMVIAAYGLLGLILTASRGTVTSTVGGLSFVIVTVFLGAAFMPVRHAARRLVDWLLYGKQLDRWELLQALSTRLSTVMQPDDLGEVLVTDVSHALHLRGAFLLRRNDRGEFVFRNGEVVGSARTQKLPTNVVLSDDALRSALGQPPRPLLLLHGKPLAMSRCQRVPDRYRPLDDLGVTLSIPLTTRSGTEAVLCLQSKLAHDAFDSDDLELLAPVMRQASAALDNALLFERLDEKVEELRKAYLRIAHEQESERKRLAKELHDGTAQELAGIITLASVADRQLEAEAPEARGTLDRLRDQAEAAYQEIRRVSQALRPKILDDFGLAPTLRRYLNQFQASTGIVIEFRSGEMDSIPTEVEMALFRVAQEAIENVRRHSRSLRAEVSLERNNGHIKLAVADNGSGLPEVMEGGIGLVGMKERIEAVGGTIRVESGPGGGVRVEADVPVREARGG